jgi:hypothetical protein
MVRLVEAARIAGTSVVIGELLLRFESQGLCGDCEMCSYETRVWEAIWKEFLKDDLPFWRLGVAIVEVH